ncbi:MAG: hypothetical protein BRD50_07765, partial [Bacteroidetes bacterium SW_11_45_7]
MIAHHNSLFSCLKPCDNAVRLYHIWLSGVYIRGLSTRCRNSYSINEPQPITISTSKTDVSCKGGSDGSISITVNGGEPPYSYFWSNFGFTKDLTNIPAGEYTVIVTDDNGCEKTATVTIDEPAQGLSVDVNVSQISCSGVENGELTANVTGGGGSSYNFNWSTGDTMQSISGLPGGTYEVTVSNGVGCEGTAAAAIEQPNPINIDMSTLDNDCSGERNGQAVPFVTGGSPPYDYSWHTEPKQTDPVADSLAAGSYRLVLTDSRGCQDTAIAEIEQPSS